MQSRGRQVHIEQDEARAGSTPRVVRYVLLISIVLAILALSAIWITGALNSPRDTGAAADTHQAVQEKKGQAAGS